MNRTAQHILFTAVLFLMTSCMSSVEMNETSAESKTIIREFTATFNTADTKTGRLESGKMEWNKGDTIRYYSRDDGPVRTYVVPEDGPSIDIPAEVGENDTYIVAVYGGKEISQRHSVKRAGLSGATSFRQKGRFSDAHVATAVSTDMESHRLTFHNNTSVISFTLKNDETDHMILSTGDGTRISAFETYPGSLASISLTDNETAIEGLGADRIRIDRQASGEYAVAVPPVTFKGFAIDLYDKTGNNIGTVYSDREVKIGKNDLLNLGCLDDRIDKEEKSASDRLERNALFDMIGALSDPTPFIKGGWLTDGTLDRWNGISLDENGMISAIDMDFTSIDYRERADDPFMPLNSLKELKSLTFTAVRVPHSLYSLTKLTYLKFTPPAGYVVPRDIVNLQELEHLALPAYWNECFFDESIFELKKLRHLEAHGMGYTGNNIEGIGTLTELEYISMQGLSLPEAGLPSSIGSLKNLYYCDLGLSVFKPGTSIPEEWNNLKELTYLGLSPPGPSNALTGDIPQGILESKAFQYQFGDIVSGNRFTNILEDLQLDGPEFIIHDIEGKKIVSNEIYRNNRYTIIYRLDVHSTHYIERELSLISERYDDVYVLGIARGYSKNYSINEIKKRRFPFPVAFLDEENNLSGYTSYPSALVGPDITIIDSKGKVTVAVPFFNRYGEIIPFVAENIYESSDYSQDGEVHVLQKATEGNGIDVVIMGDGYTDRLISDGTYMNDMRQMMEDFFSIEPYTSFRKLFNVYSVTAVSRNEDYLPKKGTESIFSTDLHFDDNTRGASIDVERVMDYANKAIDDERMNEVTIILPVYYKGGRACCYQLASTSVTDYASGPSISVICSAGKDRSEHYIVRHEACGHGFAKLGDEYIENDENGSSRFNFNYHHSIGWLVNIDTEKDVNKIQWKKFLSDSRYSNSVGIYEGAYYYKYGLFRPSVTSVMNGENDEFNAPSREMIYYRIHKLAYGKDWEYDFEDFVKYDEINRNNPSNTRTKSHARLFNTNSNHCPPVYIDKSWDELIRKETKE